jgi:hypothetical protein
VVVVAVTVVLGYDFSLFSKAVFVSFVFSNYTLFFFSQTCSDFLPFSFFFSKQTAVPTCDPTRQCSLLLVKSPLIRPRHPLRRLPPPCNNNNNNNNNNNASNTSTTRGTTVAVAAADIAAVVAAAMAAAAAVAVVH